MKVQNPLYRRLNGRIGISHALAFLRFEKGSAVQHILHALKYGRHPEIGQLLGRVYGMELRKFGYLFDVVVPVPLHQKKLHARGYNQSSVFARGLAEGMSCAFCENALSRVRQTETQTRKTRLARWLNVEDAFTLSDEEALTGKNILLVDDVITTGATIEACGRLLEANAKSLSIGCIAVA